MPKVRDALRVLRGHGWTLVRVRGSHRQLRNPTRSGVVTIAGHRNDDLPPGTCASILKQAGLKDQEDR